MFGIKVLNHLHPLFLLLFARIEFRLEMENGKRKIRRKENIYTWKRAYKIHIWQDLA